MIAHSVSYGSGVPGRPQRSGPSRLRCAVGSRPSTSTVILASGPTAHAVGYCYVALPGCAWVVGRFIQQSNVGLSSAGKPEAPQERHNDCP